MTTIDYFPQLKTSKAGQIIINNDLRSSLFKQAEPMQTMVIFDRVYDISGFFRQTVVAVPPNFMGTSDSSRSDILSIMNLYKLSPTGDASAAFNLIAKKYGAQELSDVINCFDGLLFIGVVDHTQDAQCVVPNYILLAFSVMIVAVIGVKFLAALQFTRKKVPESHDKFGNIFICT